MYFCTASSTNQQLFCEARKTCYHCYYSCELAYTFSKEASIYGCRTFPPGNFPLDVSHPPAFLHTRTFSPMYGAAECKLYFV